VLGLVLVAIALIAGGGIFLLLANPGKTAQGGGTTPTSAPRITPTAGVTLTPSPTAVVLDTNTASALVQEYFDDINAKRYDAAYDLLSSEWQQTQSRQNFISGYQKTVQDTLTILNAVDQGDGTVKVNVTLQAQNTDGTVNYAGFYLVTIENGKLVLLRGNLKQQ
jgi:hypothetical protein